MGLDEILNSYFLDTQLGYTTEQRFYENLLNEGILDKLKITRKDIKNFYATLPTDQIHTENNRLFIPIEVNNILDQFQIDLIVIIKRKATKKTYAVLHYILTVIDAYSRKASCRYIKNKKSSSTAKAFKEILEELGTPKEIRGDKGNEWAGDFLKLCKQKNIKLNLRDGDGKYSNGIIERFNRTLIGYIKRYKTENKKIDFEKVLPDFIDQYNNTTHRMIGTCPNDAYADNMVLKRTRTLTDEEKKRVFLDVGDIVRVRRETNIFTKGREERYSTNVYEIISKKGNRYKLSGEFDGTNDYSYNSLIRVKVKPDYLKKYLVQGQKNKLQQEVEDDDIEEMTQEENEKKFRFAGRGIRGLLQYNRTWGFDKDLGKRNSNNKK